MHPTYVIFNAVVHNTKLPAKIHCVAKGAMPCRPLATRCPLIPLKEEADPRQSCAMSVAGEQHPSIDTQPPWKKSPLLLKQTTSRQPPCGRTISDLTWIMVGNYTSREVNVGGVCFKVLVIFIVWGFFCFNLSEIFLKYKI